MAITKVETRAAEASIKTDAPKEVLADFKKIESAANGVRYQIGYRSHPATKRVLFDD